MLNPFSKTNESRLLYETHKHTPLVGVFKDTTELQQYWLMLMAKTDLEYKEEISVKLEGIGQGLGIKFKKRN